jgi:hypothetical protein
VSRHVRLYRGLLRVFPSAFRDEYEDEMTRLFADQLAEARSASERIAVPRLWLRCAADLASTAPRQHLGREHRMAQTVDGRVAGIDAEQRVSRARRMVVGLIPLWLFLVHRLAVPAASDPFFLKPPEMLGLPMGVIALALAACLMVSGIVALVRFGSTRLAAVTLVLLTIPAAALIALTPGFILELRRLTTS